MDKCKKIMEENDRLEIKAMINSFNEYGNRSKIYILNETINELERLNCINPALKEIDELINLSI